MIDDNVLLQFLLYLDGPDKSLAPPEQCGAWDALHREYKDAIYLRVRRVSAAREAIDDLVQDIWSAVFGGLPQFCRDRDRGTFGSWLGSIISRRLWNYRRRQSRRCEKALECDLTAIMLDKDAPKLTARRKLFWGGF